MKETGLESLLIFSSIGITNKIQLCNFVGPIEFLTHFQIYTFCISLLWEETENKCNYSFIVFKQGWFLYTSMRNQLHCRPSLVAILLHHFSLTTVYWKVVPSPKERGLYWPSPKVNKLTFLCPGFDLQSTWLQEKSNDIKKRNMKITLQINSDVIWIQDTLRWGYTMGDAKEPYHTYIMIPFAQSEKFLHFAY